MKKRKTKNLSISRSNWGLCFVDLAGLLLQILQTKYYYFLILSSKCPIPINVYHLTAILNLTLITNTFFLNFKSVDLQLYQPNSSFFRQVISPLSQPFYHNLKEQYQNKISLFKSLIFSLTDYLFSFSSPWRFNSLILRTNIALANHEATTSGGFCRFFKSIVPKCSPRI